ncbi:zinc-binding dehydrogenase [Brachymonas denitrificans]|uniref:zinc-binding dehydrogenase n=1 Tax=Brachymonas denitrificans TaxID=28220 RepID=UPI002AFE2A7B|nr:zinc-binding dehydrogenase [Brachymonas denitrificans]
MFPIPEGLSFEEAAALGVNYLTAWRMLFTKAQLKPWETVLVFGIGGGVSLAGMQLAKAAGARVIVTSREQHKIDRALGLGADAGICSSTEDVQKRVMELTGGRGVDIVFENVGEAVWSTALKSLVRGGRIVTCGATTGDQPGADLRRLFIRQLQVIGSTLGNPGELQDLLAWCAQGKVRPIIDRVLPLDAIHEGLDLLERNQQFGKLAIAIGD